MQETKYNTNLASEFYVLSMLHRLGVDATLTLGNKKSVDIVVEREGGDHLTLDVKGLAGTTAWPVDNVKDSKAGHVLVFVCYNGSIDDLEKQPNCWIIPSAQVHEFVREYPSSKRRIVSLSTLNKQAARFKDNWGPLLPLTDNRSLDEGVRG